MSIVDRLRGALSGELASLARAGALGSLTADVASSAAITLERPKRAEHGDYATNAAMVLTKLAGMPPRAIAEALVKSIASRDHEVFASAEVAGPGFVNLRIKASVLFDELDEVLRLQEGYGRAAAATGERIDLEFVSANPVGPITVAAARNAILGDTVARLLEATGHRVVREYYINDFGNQVRLFAASIAAVAAGAPLPEDGYRGQYIEELAEYIKTHEPSLLTGDSDALARGAVGLMLEGFPALRGVPGSKPMLGIRKSLDALGVHHDVWFSEESLHRFGKVALALSELDAKGFLERKDGALFFVAKKNDTKKEDGDDDKDRVVQKSDGNYAYFASDIAYLADKMSRKFDRLMIVLGIDHHGYLARLTNAVTALGYAADRFEPLLYNFVYLMRNGEVVKMGKRAGNIITSDEVLEEIDEAAGREGAGRDALRYFYLSRSANVKVDFDIELAKKATLDNPVFYVQYGHARLASILRSAREIGLEVPSRMTAAEWSKLPADELALARKLADYTQMVEQAAATREPHRVLFFVTELARDVQSYYTLHKSDPVLPPKSLRENVDWKKTWDVDKTRARLAWISALRTVYASALELLGIAAPERMERPEVAEEAEGEAEGG